MTARLVATAAIRKVQPITSSGCLQRSFQNVAEWLGDDKWRAAWGMRAMPEKVKADWTAFLDQHREWTLPDVIKKLENLQSEFERARALQATKRRGSRGRH